MQDGRQLWRNVLIPLLAALLGGVASFIIMLFGFLQDTPSKDDVEREIARLEAQMLTLEELTTQIESNSPYVKDRAFLLDNVKRVQTVERDVGMIRSDVSAIRATVETIKLLIENQAAVTR